MTPYDLFLYVFAVVLGLGAGVLIFTFVSGLLEGVLDWFNNLGE